MAKVVLWLVIVFAVLFVLRLVNAEKNRRTRRERAAKQPAQAMVRCVSCGVYVPRSDAKAGRAGLTCGDPVCLSR
ncbi:MAG TPA: PP0621 family protein [Burkholderiales bacterium]|nr:PP0621 family protein [Burkholderiales bacterium]